MNQASGSYWRPWLALCGLLLAAGVAAQDRFEAGLLWRIERSGVTPSYLFGTMHSDDPDVLDLAAPVEQAFDQAGAVTLEVTLDAQSLRVLGTALLISNGGGLDALVGADLFRRAVEAMAAHGFPEAMVARMKPWAVAVSLMTPPARSGLVLDHVLYQRALAEGKPVHALESVDEQLDLFDGMTLQEQVALLRETLDNLAEVQRMLDDVRQAWLERDLARLLEINAATLRDSDPQFAASFNQRVIVDRNQRMAERMQAHLREGGHFIAVGALHLPGEQGLLQLLERRGYRLTRVY